MGKIHNSAVRRRCTVSDRGAFPHFTSSFDPRSSRTDGETFSCPRGCPRTLLTAQPPGESILPSAMC